MRYGWTRVEPRALLWIGSIYVACTPPLTQVNSTDDSVGSTTTSTGVISSEPIGSASSTGGTANPGDGTATTLASGDSTSTTGSAPTGSSTAASAMDATGVGICGDGEEDRDEACDDANTDELDGCLSDCRQGPVGFEFGRPTTLAQYGNIDGGIAYDDTCPANQVLVGLRGAVTGAVSQMRVICGELSLVDRGTIDLAVNEGAIFPLRGTLMGVPYDATCPQGSAIIGFNGSADFLVDSLTISCAPLSLVDDGTTLSLEIGDVSELGTFGGFGGFGFPQTDCPAGEVATIANIRASASIDAFGLTCRPVSLMY